MHFQNTLSKYFKTFLPIKSKCPLNQQSSMVTRTKIFNISYCTKKNNNVENVKRSTTCYFLSRKTHHKTFFLSLLVQPYALYYYYFTVKIWWEWGIDLARDDKPLSLYCSFIIWIEKNQVKKIKNNVIHQVDDKKRNILTRESIKVGNGFHHYFLSNFKFCVFYEFFVS